MNYYIVKAFINDFSGGNTAGVVINDNIDERLMQKIAANLKFSETAFIKQTSKDIFNIKYFTPNSEISLCGHATIASFKVLKQLELVKNNSTYFIKTYSELLPVYINNDYIFMEAGTPIRGETLGIDFTNKLAAIMGIKTEDIGDLKYNLIPEIISTGLYDIMLPVKSFSILNKINPNFNELSELSKALNIVGVHAFTLDNQKYIARCRNFAPLYGINEECATGTSNASLTYYLYKNNVLKDLDKDYMFIQGESMGSSSIIITRLIHTNSIKVLVGGSACIVSEKNLFLQD